MSAIVFINPSIRDKSDFGAYETQLASFFSGKRISPTAQLTPMILAALTPAEHSFTLIDEEIEDIDFEHISADLVALTAMTAQADRAYAIADVFRGRGVKVAIGGIHATVMPDEAARHADAVCVGEGENVWPAILEDFKAGALKPRYDAKDYPPVTSMVSPRADILKHDHYSVFPVMATKGCPYDCDFCSIKYSSGHIMRMKPVEQVTAEIAALEKYNKGPIKKSYMFFDDNLYVNREYTKKLFTALKGSGVLWSGQGTLNAALDEETLKLMAEGGCRFFYIGFESVSDASLKEANKAKTNKVDLYGAAINNLNRYGIIPAGYFIFGFDNDDKDVFKKTVDFIIDKHIMHPYMGVLTPFPGTRLYDRVKGRIFRGEWKYYEGMNSVYTQGKLTAEELEAGFLWANLETRKIPLIKQQLDYFWSLGPWPWNPRLNIAERALLILMALQLSFKKAYKPYRDFILWAATNKKAADLFTIAGMIMYMEAPLLKKYAALRRV